MRLIFKDFPLPSHDLARPAHEAARCAGSMGAYWPYHDRLFAEQPHFERADLVRYASDLRLDAAAFSRCLDDHRFAAAVAADIAEGRALGVTGTPSFFVNDQPIVGAQPVENFRAVINDALREKR